MRPGPICSMPGCRNLAEPRPRALCKEHRGGGERGAPRSGRQRVFEAFAEAEAIGVRVAVCARAVGIPPGDIARLLRLISLHEISESGSKG